PRAAAPTSDYPPRETCPHAPLPPPGPDRALVSAGILQLRGGTPEGPRSDHRCADRLAVVARADARRSRRPGPATAPEVERDGECPLEGRRPRPRARLAARRRRFG